MKRIYPVLVISLILVMGSCTLFNTPPASSSSTELDAFRSKYLTSFDILNDSFSQSGRAFSPFNVPVADSQARATVPVYSLPGSLLSIPDSIAGTALSTLADYPEVGQTSSWTVEATSVTDVYLVKVTTTFPLNDPRKMQEEWYYIKDRSDAGDTPDSDWTTADIVVDAAGSADSTYRLRNWLHFRDGSIQYETIVDVRAGQDIRDGILDGFGIFNIAGSLDYPEVFLPEISTVAVYSSVVVYTRIYSDEPAYSFWGGNRVRAVVGLRYYTEHLDPATGTATGLIGTTIAFEKAVTSLYGQTGDFLDLYSSLFLPYVNENPDQSFLAMTVLRQQTNYSLSSYASPSDFTVDYNQSTRDTRARTRVINVPTQQDSYIGLVNDEAAAISTAEDSLWIPQAGEPYLSPGTSYLVESDTRNYATTLDDSADVEIITTSAPVGELGQYYFAVSTGTSPAIIEAASNSIADDLTGPTVVKKFDGSQSFLIPESVGGSLSFSDKGTVQAWVYVDRQSKESGIVHAGQMANFSDELWSLQLIGNNNTPAFSFAAQGPYVFDLVQSSEKLRKSTWYHLAVTWDRTPSLPADKKMTIYVNGIERGSKTFVNTPGSSSFAVNPPIVVGSMFYDLSQVLLSGYYGIDGRITGVTIKNEVLSSTTINDFYEANKAKTAFW